MRLSVHRCEYDGKLSLAAVNASHFRVYARANMQKHGGRHVVTALCGNRGGGEVEAYIGLSTSADGVSWRPWTRVVRSERDVDLGAKKFRYRSLDQPVCGLLRRDGRTTLYVQREVAGIYSPSQDCCNKPVTRLEAIDVSRWIN